MSTNLKSFRTRLENERKRLIEELDKLTATIPSDEEKREGSPFGKREEEADESVELEKRLALEQQGKSRLVEIEHALDKFEHGTYGLCDVCGQPIAPGRLEVLPEANLCVVCKAKNAHARFS